MPIYNVIRTCMNDKQTNTSMNGWVDYVRRLIETFVKHGKCAKSMISAEIERTNTETVLDLATEKGRQDFVNSKTQTTTPAFFAGRVRGGRAKKAM